MEILEVETFLCDEKWHEKKSREEKIIFFSQRKRNKKKSFVSGRSYELFCTKKGKFSTMKKNEGDEKKRMRNMKIFLCINLHFIFLSPNDDLFTISSHLPHSSALLPLSGFFFGIIITLRRYEEARASGSNSL